MTSTESAQYRDASIECHFTYCPPVGEDLQQGDILLKTKGIKTLLEKVHPYFLQKDYTHFIILTQSCDLVRRGSGKCAVRYITLAAVRPLGLLIQREIGKYQKSPLTRAAMACNKRVRPKLELFLERFLNNNNPDYFYLHEDAAMGFPESSCAFLRLSIPLRAYQHYKTCLKARILSLDEIFQAKLGWLVGHMYSRVGTEDWVPDNITQKEFDEYVAELLESLCLWVDHEKLKKAKREVKTALSLADDVNAALLLDDRQTLRDFINTLIIKSKRDQVLERVIQLLQEQELILDGKTAKRIFNLLRSDPTVSSLIKN